MDAKSGKFGKVDRLGAKTIDGRPAEGFRIQQGGTETKIWADAKTMLPVRLEQRMSIPSMSLEVYTEMTDFQVDAKLDESLFSVDMPDGYTAEKEGRTGTLHMEPSLPEPEGKLKAEPPKASEP